MDNDLWSIQNWRGITQEKIKDILTLMDICITFLGNGLSGKIERLQFLWEHLGVTGTAFPTFVEVINNCFRWCLSVCLICNLTGNVSITFSGTLSLPDLKQTPFKTVLTDWECPYWKRSSIRGQCKQYILSLGMMSSSTYLTEKEDLLRKKDDFCRCKVINNWSCIFERHGDGVRVRFPVKMRKFLTPSPKTYENLGQCIMEAPRTCNEKFSIKFVKISSSCK
mgnify:FL=1